MIEKDDYLKMGFDINHTHQIVRNNTTPDSNEDPYLDNQYAIPMMGVDLAWSLELGDPNYLIAIIDTGIDTDHEEFTNRISALSYNAITEEVGIDAVEDENGHGTNVAGIIGATKNNQIGIAGIVQNSMLLIIKANNTDDPSTTGNCTGGVGASCSTNRCTTADRSDITEGCVDSGDCPGGADCVFKEAYSFDTIDGCSGEDGCTSKTYDPDTNSNTCEACGLDWNIGGEVDPTECCGDDTGENVRTRQKHTSTTTNQWYIDWSDSSSDNACCSHTTDCVYGGTCYADHDRVTGVGTGHDQIATCHDSGGTGKWLDCDGDLDRCENKCNLDWLPTGDGNIGEYNTQGHGSTSCCGDDSGESSNTEISYNMNIAFVDGDNVCCSSSTDCVAGNSCYNSESAGTTHSGLNPGGNDTFAHCYNHGGVGKWLDCDQSDYMDYWCGNICGPQKGVKNPRGGGADFNWNAVYAGELGVGEYPDKTTLGCCGDDDGEYYIDSSHKYADARSCCSAADSCVDADGDCVPSDDGVNSVSDDGLNFCTAGNWEGMDTYSAHCTNGGFTWFSTIDAFAGTSYQCCGNDATSSNDNFGRMDYSNNFCRSCTNGVDQGNEICMPVGTLGNNANDGFDTCLYDPDNLDTDRSNDCTGAGCILVTENLASKLTGVDDCQYGDPGAGDNYCLENNNVVQDDTTVDQCYYDIACGLAGQTGWTMQQENCHDPNYSPTIPMGNTCWYEPFGTLQNDRSDDCDDTGCKIESCLVAVGQTCVEEPSIGFTGCVATQTKCDADCMSLGYNNGTLIGNSCNCGISDYSIQISSSNLVPIESTTPFDFNATAENSDNKFDLEDELVSMHIYDFSRSELLDATYFCNDLDGGASQIFCTKNVISCDLRSELFWMRLRDPVGNELYQVSSEVYNVKKQDSCGCVDNSDCYSDYEGNGGCDPDESHCFTCVDKTDSISGTCEYNVGCGAALLCDELEPFSCVAGQGWCNGIDGCGSSPNTFCSDEIVYTDGNTPLLCDNLFDSTQAHCGCNDNVDEGNTCDANFDGNLGICAGSSCTESLAVQINVGVVSGVGAKYSNSCINNGNKPCVNDADWVFERNGTCVVTNPGATTWDCDYEGHMAYDNSNYFSSCSLVNDGTSCDSDVSKFNTFDQYNHDGICTSGDCCVGVYVDTNENSLFDDTMACESQGSLEKINDGKLCDSNRDYSWDGYVAYDSVAGEWQCVETYWSSFDYLPIYMGVNETVKECIQGGVSCRETFDNTQSYTQLGTCARDGSSSLYCDELTHVVKLRSSDTYFDSCNNPSVPLGSECDSSVLGGGFRRDGICSSDNICCVGTYVDTNDDGLFNDDNACENAPHNALAKSNEGKRCSLTGNYIWDGYVAYNVSSANWVCDTVGPWSVYNGDITTACSQQNNMCKKFHDNSSHYVQDGLCVYDESEVLYCDNIPEVVQSQINNNFYDSCANSFAAQKEPTSTCTMTIDSGFYSYEGFCTSGDCCLGVYVDTNDNALFDDDSACESQGSLAKLNDGKLCDSDRDYSWDGYVAYNNDTLAWECVETYWSSFDFLVAFPGVNETVKECIVGGVSCRETFDNTQSYTQNGTCARNETSDLYCDEVNHLVNLSGLYYDSCNNLNVPLGTQCDSSVLGGGYRQDGICSSDDVCCVGVYVDTNDDTLFNDPGACEHNHGALAKINEGKLCDLNQDFNWDGYVAYNVSSANWVCSPVEPWSIYQGNVSVGCVVENTICHNTFNFSTNFTQDGLCVYDDSMDLICDNVPEVVETDLLLPNKFYDSCNHSNVGLVSSCDLTLDNGIFSFEGLCVSGACCAGEDAAYVDENNDTSFNDQYCGCSKEVEGFLCDKNFDKTWDGYCAYNLTSTNWECRNETPFSFYDSEVSEDDYDVVLGCNLFGAQGSACQDVFFNTHGFIQDGTCVADEMFSNGFCDTSEHLVFNSYSMRYTQDCDLPTNQIGGYACDSSVLGGDFSHDGYCAYDEVDTICHSGLTSTNCDTDVCNIENNQTYVGCIAGYACMPYSNSGFNWNQEGICLITQKYVLSGFEHVVCDAVNEVVFDGFFYHDSCENQDTNSCHYNASIGGNFKNDGKCYASECDINPPELTGPLLKNTTRNNWIGSRINMTCLNASDIGSGVNNDSFVFEYSLDNITWNYVNSCTNSTNNCIWNISSQVSLSPNNYLENLSVKCYVHDYSTLKSNEINVTFGVDNESPVIIDIYPLEGFTGSGLIQEFRFNLSDNNPNETLDRCEFRFYDTVLGELDRFEIFNYPTKNEENIVSLMGFREGSYFWNLRCYDLSDNYVQSENRTINFPPSLGFGIEPLGELGFIEGNKKYTTSRVVNLVMTLTEETDSCRYRNEIGAWTQSEKCNRYKSWLLSETPGLKLVSVNVSNYPPNEDIFVLMSDYVYYDPTGQFLDTTPPVFEYLNDEGDYTINNESLKFFIKASDLETEFMGEELIYKYSLIENDTIILSDIEFTPEVSGNVINYYSLFDEYLKNDFVYYVLVNVTNYANLSSSQKTDGIIVDTTPPEEFLIISNNHENGEWGSNSTAEFIFQTEDDSIIGYSILLNLNPNSVPDNMVNLFTENNSNYVSFNYDNLPSKYFYLHIKAKDKSGNWGPIQKFSFGVDTTKPTEPVLINSPQRANGNFVEFCWVGSKDLESGVEYYNLDIYDWNGNLIDSVMTNSTCHLKSDGIFEGKIYYADLYSVNQAGLRSDGLSFVYEPLEINFMKPIQGTTYFNSDYITISVETNKMAQCKYNNQDFMYSDGYYHEAIIKPNMNDGEVIEILVECMDSESFVYGSSSLIYLEDKPNLIELVSKNMTVYKDQKVDLYLIMKKDDKVIGELKKNNFFLGISSDYEWYDELNFVFSERGDGVYRFTFDAPNTKGEYDLEILFDSVGGDSPFNFSDLSENVALTVEELNFNIFYDFSKEQLTYDEKNIVYTQNDNLKTGLASNYGVSSRNEYRLTLTTEVLDGVVYFFVVDKDTKLSKTGNLLESGTFFDLINPSFGKYLSDEYEINTELRFLNFNFNTYKDLGNGKYLIAISNEGLDKNNKTNINLRVD